MQEQSIELIKESIISGQQSVTEVVMSHLGRIDDLDSLNANITVPRELAIERAEFLEQLPPEEKQKLPLLGVPLAVKDNIITEGIRTTAASKTLESFVPPYQSTVVKRLEDAGAIVVSKTNLDEFAMGASTETSYFGPARNPWDTSRVPGGSSGGSAIAVSAGMCAAALGSDTGGSIRQPASFCNATGLKPSYGRVSRYGLIAYASSLDQIGPMARNVKDVEAVARAIFAHDTLDSTSNPASPLGKVDFNRQDLKGLRIGIPRDFFVPQLGPEIKNKVLAASATLESLGATLVDVELPHTELAIPTYYIIAPAEASSNLSRYDGIRYSHRAKDFDNLESLYSRSRTESFGPETKRRIMIGSYVLSSGYYDAFYRKAQKVRTLIKQDYYKAFEHSCDAILAPVSPTTAFKLGEKLADPLTMYLCDIFTAPVNLAGLPSLSLPCGFSEQGGLPIGMQLIGPGHSDELLLEIGHMYQQETAWHNAKPQIDGIL